MANRIQFEWNEEGELIVIYCNGDEVNVGKPPIKPTDPTTDVGDSPDPVEYANSDCNTAWYIWDGYFNYLNFFLEGLDAVGGPFEPDLTLQLWNRIAQNGIQAGGFSAIYAWALQMFALNLFPAAYNQRTTLTVPQVNDIVCVWFKILSAGDFNAASVTVLQAGLRELKTKYPTISQYLESYAGFMSALPLADLRRRIFDASLQENLNYECSDCEDTSQVDCTTPKAIILLDSTKGDWQTIPFVLKEGCCYEVKFDGTVVSGNETNPDTLSDGVYNSQAGGAWQLIGREWVEYRFGNVPTSIPFATIPPVPGKSFTGYTFRIPATGEVMQLRWGARIYKNNSGTMTVTVQGIECPGGS